MEQQQPETKNIAQCEQQSENKVESINIANKAASRRVLYLVVGLIVLFVIVSVAFYFNQLHEEEKKETIAYNTLEQNNNPKDYRNFLEQFPESPRVEEVKKRLKALEDMLEVWRTISLSGNVNDFVEFNKKFDNAQYNRFCEIKIDSLDYLAAQRLGTLDAYRHYLDMHPDGIYASEASIALGNLQALEVTPEEQEQVIAVINDFFHGFETADETLIFPNITATMKRFLDQGNVTKAAVMNTINGMFNKHIEDCRFIVNRDINIVRLTNPDYQGILQVTFTADLHIERNNKGKTFASYKCVAQLTPQMLINSLIMDEISKQYNL